MGGTQVVLSHVALGWLLAHGLLASVAMAQNPVADAAKRVPLRVGRADPPMVFGFREGVRDVVLHATGTRVTRATIGGAPLAAERLVHRDGRWFVLDEAGGVAADLALSEGQGRLRTHSDRGKTTLGFTVNRPERAKLLLYKLDPLRTLEVVDVKEAGAAARSGVRVGDVLIEVEGRASVNRLALREALTVCRPGGAIKVKVLRGGNEIELSLLVERDYAFYARPDELADGVGDGVGAGGVRGRSSAGGGMLRTVDNNLVLVPPPSEDLAGKVKRMEERMERMERLLEVLVQRSSPKPAILPRK